MVTGPLLIRGSLTGGDRRVRPRGRRHITLRVPASMAYTFLNITTMQTFACDDEEWRAYLERARAAGWEEEGTAFDFECEVDDAYDPMVDYLYNLLLIFYVSRDMLEWDGNYIDKKNQVVSDSDAYCLMQALEAGWSSPDRGFLDFLNSGPFRILRD